MEQFDFTGIFNKTISIKSDCDAFQITAIKTQCLLTIIASSSAQIDDTTNIESRLKKLDDLSPAYRHDYDMENEMINVIANISYDGILTDLRTTELINAAIAEAKMSYVLLTNTKEVLL